MNNYNCFKSITKTAKNNNLLKIDNKNLLDLNILNNIDINDKSKQYIIQEAKKDINTMISYIYCNIDDINYFVTMIYYKNIV